jgi:hypothetical protein
MPTNPEHRKKRQGNNPQDRKKRLKSAEVYRDSLKNAEVIDSDSLKDAQRNVADAISAATSAAITPASQGASSEIVQKSDQYKVDQIIVERFSRSEKEDFEQFCRRNSSPLDIQRYLVESVGDEGYVPVAAIDRWYQSSFGVGDEAGEINDRLSVYRGIDVERIIEWQAVQLTNLLQQGLQAIAETEAFESIDNPIAIIRLVNELSVQLRNTSKDIVTTRNSRLKRAMEASGAYIVAEIFRAELSHLKPSWEEPALMVLQSAIEQAEARIGVGQNET